MAEDRLDVCLLVGSRSVPKPFATAVEAMIEQTPAEVVLVVIARTPTTRTTPSRFDVVRPLVNVFLPERNVVDLTTIDRLSPMERIECSAEPRDGVGVTLPNHVVDRIAEEGDVVLHRGVGILKGRILTAPKDGVVGFHHGDLREYRGSGYGFWEYVDDVDEGGVTLQRLTSELDAGEVVSFERVDLSDTVTYRDVYRRLGAAEERVLTDGVRNLLDPRREATRIPEEELGEMYSSEQITATTRLKFVYREIANRLRRRARLPLRQ